MRSWEWKGLIKKPTINYICYQHVSLAANNITANWLITLNWETTPHLNLMITFNKVLKLPLLPTKVSFQDYIESRKIDVVCKYPL